MSRLSWMGWISLIWLKRVIMLLMLTDIWCLRWIAVEADSSTIATGPWGDINYFKGQLHLSRMVLGHLSLILTHRDNILDSDNSDPDGDRERFLWLAEVVVVPMVVMVVRYQFLSSWLKTCLYKSRQNLWKSIRHQWGLLLRDLDANGSRGTIGDYSWGGGGG